MKMCNLFAVIVLFSALLCGAHSTHEFSEELSDFFDTIPLDYDGAGGSHFLEKRQKGKELFSPKIRDLLQNIVEHTPINANSRDTVEGMMIKLDNSEQYYTSKVFTSVRGPDGRNIVDTYEAIEHSLPLDEPAIAVWNHSFMNKDGVLDERVLALIWVPGAASGRKKLAFNHLRYIYPGIKMIYANDMEDVSETRILSLLTGQ